MSRVYQDIEEGSVVEYQLSQIGRYMLDPNPIEVEKKLIGCEVRYNQPFLNNIKRKVRWFLPQRLRDCFKDKKIASDVLIPRCEIKIPALNDRNLFKHIEKIDSLLRIYNPIRASLAKLNMSKLSDIVGICEDIDGNSSWLNIRGTTNDKINYMANYISKDTRIVLDKANVAEGLFEMRGFDFTSYNPEKIYR